MSLFRRMLIGVASRKDVIELLRDARRCGCEVRTHGQRHIRITTPSGKPVFLARTPSDRRAMSNARAVLRRNGVPV